MIKDDIKEALKNLDSIFNREILDFLASLYDPDSGLFYSALSGKENEPFLPGIETAYYILDIIKMTGCLEIKSSDEQTFAVAFPAEMLNKIRNFVIASQDSEDGYFYPFLTKDVTESRKEYDVSSARGLLGLIGGSPLYPYPDERIAKEASSNGTGSSTPDFLKSDAALEQWILSLPWESNPYTAGSTLATKVPAIAAAKKTKKAVSVVNSLQSPLTGYFGNDNADYYALSGAMKVTYLYMEAKAEYPMYSLMLKTTRSLIMSELVPEVMTFVYNPWALINRARRSQRKAKEADENFFFENCASLINETAKHALLFKRADGGFSYGINGAAKTSQNFPVCLGLCESDIGGVANLLASMRQNIYECLDIPMPNIFTVDDGKYFLSKLAATKPTVKKKA